jgi:signal transduction histidine kinase
LLDDALELTRIEIGVGKENAIETFALADAVTAMRERLLPLAARAGIELALETAPGMVTASRQRIEQLVVNLIRNAMRAIESCGDRRWLSSSAAARTGSRWAWRTMARV